MFPQSIGCPCWLPNPPIIIMSPPKPHEPAAASPNGGIIIHGIMPLIMFAFMFIMAMFIMGMCMSGIIMLFCIIVADVPGLDAIPVMPMTSPTDGWGEWVKKGVVVVGKGLLLKLWLW